MFIHVAVIVFLFLARVRFPKSKSIAEVIRSHFIFNGLFYKQIDGVAMGSPLRPSLADAFLSYHEKNWLNNCP